MRALYTPDTDEKLIRWAAAGHSVADQARWLGVSRDRVVSWRRRLRLGTPAPRSEISAELDAKIRTWIEDGWPLKEIHETSGVSLPRLRRDYPEAGLKDPREQGSLAAVRLALHRKKKDKWKVLSCL